MRILAGNHDIRVMLGMRSVNRKVAPGCEHFFIRMGAKAVPFLKEINDSFELMESMNISAEVSVKTVGYKAEGKAKFAKDVKVSGFSSTFVIEAEVQNGAEFAAPTPKRPRGKAETVAAVKGEGAVRLTPEAAKLARTDIDLFKASCGNGFVSATMGGAKLTAVVDIETKSRSERETMKAEVSGSGWGVKVKAAMGSDKSSASSSFKREISFYQTGGKNQDLPTGEEAIIKRVEELAKQASDAEKLFQIAVTPYEVLENWPRGEELTGEETEFTQLAALWGAYNTLYDEIQEAMNEPGAFVVPVAACEADGQCTVRFMAVVKETGTYRILEDLQDEVLAALDWLERDAEGCVEAQESCEFDAGRYRSPYAIRARLPIPKAVLYDEPGPVAAATTAQSACAKLAANSAKEDIDECKRLTTAAAGDAGKAVAAASSGASETTALSHAAKAAMDACAGLTPESDQAAIDQCKGAAGFAAERAAMAAETVQSACAGISGAAACGEPSDQYLRYFIGTQIHDMAKSRCRFGSRTPGCLSNAKIRAWGARTGYRTAVFESAEALSAAKQSLPPGALLEAGDPGAEDGLVLWFAGDQP